MQDGVRRERGLQALIRYTFDAQEVQWNRGLMYTSLLYIFDT